MKWRTKGPAPSFTVYKATFYHPDEQELVEQYTESCAVTDGTDVRHLILPVILGTDFISKMYPIDNTKEDPRDQIIVTAEFTALELSDQLVLTQQAAATPMGRDIRSDWDTRRRYAMNGTPLAIVVPSLALSAVEAVL